MPAAQRDGGAERFHAWWITRTNIPTPKTNPTARRVVRYASARATPAVGLRSSGPTLTLSFRARCTHFVEARFDPRQTIWAQGLWKGYGEAGEGFVEVATPSVRRSDGFFGVSSLMMGKMTSCTSRSRGNAARTIPITLSIKS